MNLVGFDSTEGVVSFSMEDNEGSNGFYTDSWLCHSEPFGFAQDRLREESLFLSFRAEARRSEESTRSDYV